MVEEQKQLNGGDAPRTPRDPIPVAAPSVEGGHNTALRVWHLLFLAVLLPLGGYCGFRFGSFVVAGAAKPQGSSNNNYVDAYHDLLNTSGGQLTTMIALTILGILIAYLIASPAFNKVVQTGEHLKGMKSDEKIATFTGLILGLLLTLMLSPILFRMPFGLGLTILGGVALVYLSVVAMTSMKDELRLYLPSSASNSADGGPDAQPEKCKILDTNVIIDGRVADICRAGFLEGTIYVPGFVLDELQHIADSADGLKRARGRRGLDILNEMRTELKMMVRTYDNVDPARPGRGGRQTGQTRQEAQRHDRHERF